MAELQTPGLVPDTRKIQGPWSIVRDKLVTETMEYKRDAVNLLVLITVASAIGVYLIATTVLISKDGVTYIERAQRFSSDPAGVTKAHPPGYPILIFLTHELIMLFADDSSVLIWACSAQATTLLCRLLALVPLYLIGKLLVDAQKSFWMIFILIILPYPAEFGSDVLRDWPYVLFLATGFFFLLVGSMQMKWWMFGIAGFVAGLGHIIRPECAQLVMYGFLWLLTRLMRPKRCFAKSRVALALFILLIGFLIPSVPYRKMRGNLLPTNLNELLGSSYEPESDNTASRDNVDRYVCSLATTNHTEIMTKGIAELAERVSEGFFYFFLPPLLLGACMRYRKRSEVMDIEKFFVSALVVFNIVMLLLLHHYYGYISRRHTLPLVAFTLFYVPLGLQTLGSRLEHKANKEQTLANKNSQRWFFILMAIGFAVCLPKLLRPIGADKRGFRCAAKWLKENTDPEDVIAVPDPRITFYAERKGPTYTTEAPKEVGYVVRIVKNGGGGVDPGRRGEEKYSVQVDKRSKNGTRLLIYKTPWQRGGYIW